MLRSLKVMFLAIDGSLDILIAFLDRFVRFLHDLLAV